MKKDLDYIPSVLFLYPFFWLLGVVPIFWLILGWFTYKNSKQGSNYTLSRYPYVIAILCAVSIPFGMFLEESVPFGRLVGAFGNILVWLIMGFMLKTYTVTDLSRLSNSLMSIGLCQGVLTGLAILVPDVQNRVPFLDVGFLGSGGTAFGSGKLFYLDWLDGAVYRSAGISGHPTWAGAVAFSAFVIGCFVFTKRVSGSRFLAILTLFFTLINIYLAQSRNLYLSATLFLAVYFILKVKDANKATSNLLRLSLLGLAVLSMALLSTQFLALLLEINNARAGSSDTRFEIYSATWERISTGTRGLMGFGFKPQDSSLVASVGTHSTYLGVLFKAGVLALFAYLAFLMKSFSVARKFGSALAQSTIVFLALWTIFEDLDPGHLLPIYSIFLFKIGIAMNSDAKPSTNEN